MDTFRTIQCWNWHCYLPPFINVRCGWYRRLNRTSLTLTKQGLHPAVLNQLKTLLRISSILAHKQLLLFQNIQPRIHEMHKSLKEVPRAPFKTRHWSSLLLEDSVAASSLSSLVTIETDLSSPVWTLSCVYPSQPRKIHFTRAHPPYPLGWRSLSFSEVLCHSCQPFSSVLSAVMQMM